MDIIDIISKKRDGLSLSRQEIEYFVEGYTSGSIADYQAAALLMAIYINGLMDEETISLTMAMKSSGDTVDLTDIQGVTVDKHSTGGVGDKTTLIVGPMAASCGLTVAKMSGRGLGMTGGTVDKLQSIPEFETEISSSKFADLVNQNGISIMGQTGDIAKADKLLYALRDVTATVGNNSLIASSIMSKKLAAGCDSILLDVKCGMGSFMNTLEDAITLSEIMVKIGRGAGKKTVCAITSMNQPLGLAVGNSLEVMEAIDVLKGGGPEDIRRLSVELSAIMLRMGNICGDLDEGRAMAVKSIESGSALEKFRKLVVGQNGDGGIVDDYSLFPQAQFKEDITAPRDGFITCIDGSKVGFASQKTGAGRMKKDDVPDLSAGILLGKKVGDRVHTGDILASVLGNDREKVLDGARMMKSAFTVDSKRASDEELILKVIGLKL